MKPLHSLLLLLTATAAIGQQRLDYSFAQSPVKNQADRGTCTAFGICAAFETSPLVPSDMSEQYVFAMIKYNHYTFRNFSFAGQPEKEYLSDEGEMLENYINCIRYSGLVPEEMMPYDPSAPIARNDSDLFNKYMDITKNVPAEIFESARRECYKLGEEQFEYLDLQKVKDINYIKQLLQSGITAIPVCYNINSTGWSRLLELSSLNIDYPVISFDDIMQVKQDGSWLSVYEAKKKDPLIEENILMKRIEIRPRYKNPKSGQPEFIDGGHCVTIVGYTEDGFIIKNSWGTDWAYGGYAVVSFNYHKLLSKEALVLKNFRIQKNGIAGPFDVLQKENLRLKLLPSKVNGLAQTKLSLFYLGPRLMPELEQVNIKFYNSNTNALIGAISLPMDSAAQASAFTRPLPAGITFALMAKQPVYALMDITYNNGLRKVSARFEGLQWKNETYRSL